MRIEWAMLCRYAEANRDGAILVGAGAEVFEADDLPTTQEFGLAVGLRIAPPDWRSIESLVIRVFDPDMNQVSEATLDIELGRPRPDHPGGHEYASLYFTRVDVPVAALGAYVVEAVGGRGSPFTLLFYVTSPATA